MSKTKRYDCGQCPGYCCSYDWIEATERDVARLATHFGLTPGAARDRLTKAADNGRIRVLRHRVDGVYKSMCMFFDQEQRRCTVYSARPSVCRQYPSGKRCGYFDFLKFEREQQGDDTFIPGSP